MNVIELEDVCIQAVEEQKALSPDQRKKLDLWLESRLEFCSSLASHFFDSNPDTWNAFIKKHQIATHSILNYFEEESSLGEITTFFKETCKVPSFTSMLAGLLNNNFPDQAMKAIQKNYDDEFKPLHHKVLLAHMMGCLEQQAPGLSIKSDESSNRHLGFHYGHHNDPYFLIGLLYATELVAGDRLQRIGKGMRRQGIDITQMDYITVHSQLDDHHAEEWLEEVIKPILSINPMVKSQISKGIAVILSTSVQYFDSVQQRLKHSKTKEIKHEQSKKS